MKKDFAASEFSFHYSWHRGECDMLLQKAHLSVKTRQRTVSISGSGKQVLAFTFCGLDLYWRCQKPD